MGSRAFERSMTRGPRITGASVERIEDDDDDWIVFEIGVPDTPSVFESWSVSRERLPLLIVTGDPDCASQNPVLGRWRI